MKKSYTFFFYQPNNQLETIHKYEKKKKIDIDQHQQFEKKKKL